MKLKIKLPVFLTLALLFLFCRSFSQSMTSLQGAWLMQDGKVHQILLFQDGYFTHSQYELTGRKFGMSRGGTYTISGNHLTVLYEFHSSLAEEVGKQVRYSYSLKNNRLDLDINGKVQSWVRLDESASHLAGVWKISERMSDGELVPIHQAGTRKTLKLLTGTRFHWFAIDPGTKQFSGTGGGTYTFRDGKYTENIEFFSRDNNRVGASLSFDGKLQDGKWHHSGTSSKGDKIYEVWAKVNK